MNPNLRKDWGDTEEEEADSNHADCDARDERTDYIDFYMKVNLQQMILYLTLK